MSQIHAFTLLILYTGSITQNEATRCFECTGVPYPRDCTKIVTCDANEYCSTEQIVTTSGHIIYNLGCLTKDRCSQFSSGLLLGKRDLNITARSSTDISTCVECCSGNFCNDKGCGSQAVPLGQRGPYCYNCDSVLDVSACDQVAVCQTNENCLIYSPPEYNGLPETVYRTQCETKLGCNALALAVSNYKCPPMCCGADFCNDHCGIHSNSNMSTPAHDTTIQPAPTHPAIVSTTQQPVVTNHPVFNTTTTVSHWGLWSDWSACSVTCDTGTRYRARHCEDGSDCVGDVFQQEPCTPTRCLHPVEFRCKQDHYYDDITGMCIKIDETRKLNQSAAKRACEEIGDHLVTIDMHEKTIFVENMILHHSRLLNEKERTYYIGLYDKYDTTEFYWPNGNKLHYTNWGGGDMEAPNRQPDDGPGVHQDCVILWGPDHYRWHDDPCSLEQYFICEDSTYLKQTAIVPGASSSTSQSHCEHDGYIYLHNNNAQLCVHIVTIHNTTWDAAQTQCKKEHGDLVVLDTHEKALLMRQKIQADYSSRDGYWIGGKDFQSTDLFSWVNGVRINDQNADWDRGQPNHYDGGHIQDCAVMWKGSREPFQWHDDYCSKPLAFICERH